MVGFGLSGLASRGGSALEHEGLILGRLAPFFALRPPVLPAYIYQVFASKMGSLLPCVTVHLTHRYSDSCLGSEL